MMRTKRHRQDITVHIACALAVLGGIAGCDRASPSDPAPPSGGRTYVLSYNTFTASVDPILSAKGCDNLDCHGGGIRGTFQLSPPGAKDTSFDYQQACLQVAPADPKTSPLLLKPLAAECGGTQHGGGAFFFSLDDPDYVTLATWAESGVYK